MKRLLFSLVLMGTSFSLFSQKYFKKYIDSEAHCDDFNTQVLNINDSIFLVNFVSCDPGIHYSNILQYDIKGNLINSITLNKLVNNVKSAHFDKNKLFLAGVNNNENPDSEFVIWDGDVKLDDQNYLRMHLFDPPADVYLNSMGTVDYGSSKILFGQYQLKGDSKVYSYQLWLDHNLMRDSMITFDTAYDWSIISDAKIDTENNIVVLIDALKVVDNISYYNRILQKYNIHKEKVFEWKSNTVGFIEGIGSFAVMDSNQIVLEFVSIENGHIHTLSALDDNMDIIWDHTFHLEDPLSLYRIHDILITSSGDILCCGTYRNISQNILETGYLCKLDRFGKVIWERIFYDQEELHLPESGINKVIHFNSLIETSDNSIAIGGRVIHNFLSPNSSGDIFFAVLDSNGCIVENCPDRQDITRFGGFIDENKTWTEGYVWFDARWSFRYKFDTIPIEIGEDIYYELLRSDSETSTNWNSTGAFLRYEEGVVFQNDFGGTEQMIYDFNIVPGDTFYLGGEFSGFKYFVEDMDTISLANGDIKKRWILQALEPDNPEGDNAVIWIEDIGSLNGLLSNYVPWTHDAEFSSVLCVKWIDHIVYDNPDFESCWLLSTSIDDEGDFKGLELFPNPASNEITILQPEYNIKSVKLFDSLGQFIIQKSSNKIALNNLTPGYYTIVVQLENHETRVGNFIKI